MFTRLEAKFKVLTPMFLGDADQMAELRPPSIKGILRYWYRAVNPHGLHREAGIFGGAGNHQGQAPFFISINGFRPGESDQSEHKSTVVQNTWGSFRENQFRGKGNGKYPVNGLRYLGFSFPMTNNKRKTPRTCIEPGKEFDLNFLFPKTPNNELRKSLLASIWLMGHVGAAGSRSKRGFGGMAIKGWRLTKTGRIDIEKSNDPLWNEMQSLPLLHKESSPKEWLDKFKTITFQIARNGWFKASENGHEIHHPHFGEQSKFIIPLEQEKGYALHEWDKCLNDMGLMMQRFRQLSPPDYKNVKQQILGEKRLEQAPDRASFGLPLIFRYRSIKNMKNSIEFAPKNGDRHGSLLHIRPILIKERLFPLFLRLDGDVPAGKGARIKRSNVPIKSFSGNAMDRFFDQLKGGAHHG